jgi:hypothetical protein
VKIYLTIFSIVAIFFIFTTKVKLEKKMLIRCWNGKGTIVCNYWDGTLSKLNVLSSKGLQPFFLFGYNIQVGVVVHNQAIHH